MFDGDWSKECENKHNTTCPDSSALYQGNPWKRFWGVSTLKYNVSQSQFLADNYDPKGTSILNVSPICQVVYEISCEGYVSCIWILYSLDWSGRPSAVELLENTQSCFVRLIYYTVGHYLLNQVKNRRHLTEYLINGGVSASRDKLC